MNDGQIFFDESVENDMTKSDKIWKIATEQSDYTIYCFLDYPYFKELYKL